MRYRWKLLILFITITLIPILSMRIFGVRSVRKLGNELVFRMSENRIANMQHRLKLLLGGYSSMIWTNRKQVEMALLFQAKEVRLSLKKKAPHPSKIYFAEDFNEGENLPPDTTISTNYFKITPKGSMGFLKISTSHQVFKTAPGVQKKEVEADIAKLSTMTPVYREISEQLHGLVYWQLTSLENGLHSAYPGHNGIPRRLDPKKQPWYTGALENKPLWTEPYVDPETRQIVIAATMPIKHPLHNTRGVTALVIPINKVLNRGSSAPDLPPKTQSFICYLTTNPKTGTKGIQIYVREEYTDLKHRSWRSQIESEWLTSNNEKLFQDMLVDFEAGKSNSRRMPYKGKDSLWVYGPAEGNIFLVLITPYEAMLKDLQQPKLYIKELVNNLLTFTRYGMILVVLVVVTAAFLFSRTITKPIQALVEGAHRLAKGQFDSRVDIRSRDEFGDMGTVFNTIGPRLKEFYQMRHSLVLAKEVQQNLIPKSDPEVKGLDIAGECLYCDDTGGDYYDYLNIKNDQGRIRIVVGDVSDHGIPSALLMTTARALLRQCSALSGDLQQIASDVNLGLIQDIEESGRFMTLFFCKINSRKKTINWVRAGHDPAIFYDPFTDAFDELAGQGLPLGVFENSVCQELKRDISTGQIILIGTDGIWETAGPSGELFGKERLHHIIRSNVEKSAKKIVSAIIEAVNQFRSPLEQEDDITLVVVKIK